MARALTLPARIRWYRPWRLAFSLTAALTMLGVAAAVRGGAADPRLLPTALTMAVLLLPYAFFALTSAARDLRILLAERPYLVWICACLPVGLHLIYSLGTVGFEAAATLRLGLFVLVPTLACWLARAEGKPVFWDLVAVAGLWLPFDLGWLRPVWPWPAGNGAYMFNTFLAIDLALVLFVGLRGRDEPKFRLSLDRRDFTICAVALGLMLLAVVPAGLLTGFLRWNPDFSDPARAALLPLGILLTVAIPEELLFRGLLQGLLTRRTGRPVVALVATSVVFGAAHLNNGAAPDPRYFLLATVAGLIYGQTYRRTGSIWAPALVHAAVDTLWVWFLHA